MATKYFVLGLWHLEQYAIWALCPFVTTILIMVISGRKSPRGTNYKKLLALALILLSVAVGTLAFGSHWTSNAAQIGAANTDLLVGVTILLMLLQVLIVGAVAFTVFTKDN